MPAHRDYLFDLGYELKHLALEAKRERDNASQGTEDRAFKSGRLLAFYEVLSMMQNRAGGLGIPLADLRLDDIVPDRDLI